MTIEKKPIFGREQDVLILAETDDTEISLLDPQLFHHTVLQTDLNSMHYLSLFPDVTTLILTSGEVTTAGFHALYGIHSLSQLILDYEETDTDAEGIELDRFPRLCRVLSRSNLNIKGYDENRDYGYPISVLNYYLNGKPQKVKYDPNYNLYQPDRFLFFSAEAWSPAGAILMRLLVPVEKVFRKKYHHVLFSEMLDSVAIIPMCFPDHKLADIAIKERRYVSVKKKYADIRLILPYEPFVSGSTLERKKLCIQNIEAAAKYIATKDSTFRLKEFLEAIYVVFSEL